MRENSAPQCAIVFHPEGYSRDSQRIVGRRAAGAGFLHGVTRYGMQDALRCMCETPEYFASFTTEVRQIRADAACRWIVPGHSSYLRGIDCLYRPDCSIDRAAWVRRAASQRDYSICGVTHTICTSTVMDAVGQYMIAPLQTWDAVICTSRAAKAAMDNMLAGMGEFLQERMGGRPLSPVQMPIIPLGVNCDDYACDDSQKRDDWRKRLSIRAEDVAVLYFGRLSFHAKAHPLPMITALATAGRLIAGNVHLIFAGRFTNAPVASAFQAAVRGHRGDVTVHFVDGQCKGIEHLWSAADMFCSLADNLQESFGLTPIEAMAAGLPCVVSDWDGYRDTVRHGVDGFRVPTVMPPSGAGAELAWRHFSGRDQYDRYVGNSSQSVAVDFAATVEAFRRLLSNPPLRRRMGDAARRHAREQFEWRVIIRRYLDLWSELSERRASDHEVAPRLVGESGHPLRADPFGVFSSYATYQMNEATVVQTSPHGDRGRLKLMFMQPMTNFAVEVLGTEDECAWVLDKAKGTPRAVGELLSDQRPERRQAFLRMLGWLAKTDLIRVDGLSTVLDGELPEDAAIASAEGDVSLEMEGAKASMTRRRSAVLVGAQELGERQTNGNRTAHSWWSRLRRKPR